MERATEQSGNTTSLLDGAIQMVKRFMSRPPSPQDLTHLLNELESVKSYMADEENQESGEGTGEGEPQDKKGLAILIGVGKKSNGGKGK